jgi:DNA gyrase subunit A
MAQDFSLRYPLVQGQGNFGSIDGDPPAAMRYTEAKLSSLSGEFLSDLPKDTVEFIPNFDGTLTEPEVLPCRFPHLLVNGGQGIAVGMATSIPPHNITEVCDAIIHFIHHPEANLSELTEFIQGPDFPTGGMMLREGIREIYEKGQGRVKVWGKVRVENLKGRSQLIITEIPYQVNKSSLVSEIAKDKKIEEIAEVRDESDREGLRIRIELKKGATPQSVLNFLYRGTQLSSSFPINLLALINGEPRTFTLLDYISRFVEFRSSTILRRLKYELTKAKERYHILEGLTVALDNIDEIISLIRSSQDREEAKTRLIMRFNISPLQAEAILAIELQRLAALEREKIREEKEELTRRISEMSEIIEDPHKIREQVVLELSEIKSKYGDRRRTEVVSCPPGSGEEILHRPMVVLLNHKDYLRCIPVSEYTRRRSDEISLVINCMSSERVFFFTDQGRVASLAIKTIPLDGVPLKTLISLGEKEKVVHMEAIGEETRGKSAILATKGGILKKIDGSEIWKVRKSGVKVMKLPEGQKIVGASILTPEDKIILVTQKGRVLRCSPQHVPSSRRGSGGKPMIKFPPDDEVCGIHSSPHGFLLLATTRGFLRLFPVANIQLSAGRRASKIVNLSEKTGKVMWSGIVYPEDRIVLIPEEGKIRPLKVSKISTSQVQEFTKSLAGVYVERAMP